MNKKYTNLSVDFKNGHKQHEDIYDALVDYAEENDMTMAAAARSLIKKALKGLEGVK